MSCGWTIFTLCTSDHSSNEGRQPGTYECAYLLCPHSDTLPQLFKPLKFETQTYIIFVFLASSTINSKSRPSCVHSWEKIVPPILSDFESIQHKICINITRECLRSPLAGYLCAYVRGEKVFCACCNVRMAWGSWYRTTTSCSKMPCKFKENKKQNTF